jgi:hypothetical protein
MTEKIYENWNQLIDEQMNRLSATFAELAKLEAQAAAEARRAIDETARLCREGLERTMVLSAEWRKVALENVNHAASLNHR